jgi:hypothetical protein
VKEFDMTTMAPGVILLPGPEDRMAEASILAPRVASLEDATIGIVNNSWRCMNILSDELSFLMAERFGVAEILEERISAAQTLPLDRLDQMAARCHAVIVGIGN